MHEIRFYRTSSGRSPVEQFIRSLSEKQKDSVIAALELIETEDHVPREVFKKLAGTGGLWEVRAQHAGVAIRLLGFLDGPRLVVLVSGFTKKTRKVPGAEIAVAQQRRREYEERRRYE